MSGNESGALGEILCEMSTWIFSPKFVVLDETARNGTKSEGSSAGITPEAAEDQHARCSPASDASGKIDSSANERRRGAESRCGCYEGGVE